MKKFLVMFAIAGALVSCNDSSSTTTDPAVDSARIADSTKKAEDSIKALTPATPADSLTTATPVDSTKKPVDSTKK